MTIQEMTGTEMTVQQIAVETGLSGHAIRRDIRLGHLMAFLTRKASKDRLGHFEPARYTLHEISKWLLGRRERLARKALVFANDCSEPSESTALLNTVEATA
jgi:hypothetical protein